MDMALKQKKKCLFSTTGFYNYCISGKSITIYMYQIWQKDFIIGAIKGAQKLKFLDITIQKYFHLFYLWSPLKRQQKAAIDQILLLFCVNFSSLSYIRSVMQCLCTWVVIVICLKQCRLKLLLKVLSYKNAISEITWLLSQSHDFIPRHIILTPG